MKYDVTVISAPPVCTRPDPEFTGYSFFMHFGRTTFFAKPTISSRRIVLEGVGDKALSDDEITVEPSDGGSRILYVADIRLKGLRRIAEPLLRPVLRKTVDEALAGLKQTLDRPA